MLQTNIPYLDEKVFLLLNKNYALCKKVVDRVFAKTGITLAEYSLLRLLQTTPAITASAARKRLFTSAPSIAQLVKSVEGKGLMLRGSDTTDTRRQPMTLTKKGETLLSDARKIIQKSLRTLAIPDQLLQDLHNNLSTLFISLSSYEE